MCAGGAGACLYVIAGGSARLAAIALQERTSFGEAIGRLRRASQDEAFETFAFCAVHKKTNALRWSSVQGHATSIAPGHERTAYREMLKAILESGWKTTDVRRISVHTHPIFLGITNDVVRSAIRASYRERVAMFINVPHDEIRDKVVCGPSIDDLDAAYGDENSDVSLVVEPGGVWVYSGIAEIDFARETQTQDVRDRYDDLRFGTIMTASLLYDEQARTAAISEFIRFNRGIGIALQFFSFDQDSRAAGLEAAANGIAN